jgi:hypothetical protein
MPEWVGNLLAACLLCAVAALIIIAKPISRDVGMSHALGQAFGLRYVFEQPKALVEAQSAGNESSMNTRPKVSLPAEREVE